MDMKAIVAHLGAAKQGCVLATLVTVEGSSYRKRGARMLIIEGRRRIGSISGGCLEEDLVERSQRVASTGKAELVLYDTSTENDLLWGVGTGCRGVVRILLEALPAAPPWAGVVAENLLTGRPTRLDVVWESRTRRLGTLLSPSDGAAPPDFPPGIFRDTIEAPPALAIFGAGDDARPLSRIACDLGWNVTVADPRAAMLTDARFPGAAGLVLGSADELVARAAPRQDSLAVVMTHHYRHDLPLMRHLLPLPLAYIGLLGPRIRAEKILADLETGGLAVTASMLARLRAPVGLDLGGDGPEEVALSVIAEMKSVLAGRDGRPLRERTLPIHA